MIDFIHISDTHFGPSRDMEIRGANPYQRNRALVEAINGLPFVPKFIVHTGDIVNDPDDLAYELAEEVLSDLRAPVHFVSGNHDSVHSVQGMMSCAWHTPLDGVENKMAYSFEIDTRTTGVVFDAWVPEEVGPHGLVPENQIVALERLLRDGPDQQFALFLHYPMLPVGSPWTDRTLLVENGAEIHRRLLAFRERCRGVFFGHLHRGIQIYREGIMYSGVSSPVCHFSCGPDEEQGCEFDSHCSLPFNHVTIDDGVTMVKEYSIPIV